MNNIFSTFQEQINLFFKEVLVIQEEIVVATNDKIGGTIKEYNNKTSKSKKEKA